jgi:hypothetical protein
LSSAETLMDEPVETTLLEAPVAEGQVVEHANQQ